MGPGSTVDGVTTRIVIAGGGIGGVTAARELDRLLGKRRNVEITLINRDNFFLLSPLLFEACSGVLELRHCAEPIRPCLRRVQFVEGTVEGIDVDNRIVRVIGATGTELTFPYDQLVVSLGATTNVGLIPGSEHALTFKCVADALLLRNHIIELLERAYVERDPERRAALLTFAVIGGGLVGVELLGELTAFVDEQLRFYPRIGHDEVRFHLFEAGSRLLPESTPFLARYAERVFRERGATVHVATPVQSIEPECVRWRGGSIASNTIILVSGIVPNAVAAATAVERDKRGRILTTAALQSQSHPDVWALGDCASIPAPDGRPYPALAQHALREGRAVARNVAATLAGRAPRPFVYNSLGTMAAFGRTRAAVDLRGLEITGFVAWWMRRTYYLFQMPRWERRLRIALDWTVSLVCKPDLTKIDPAPERMRNRFAHPAGALADRAEVVALAMTGPNGRIVQEVVGRPSAHELINEGTA